MVNGGVGNSFVFNLFFLSCNVFQKRKPPSKLGASVLPDLALLTSWWTMLKGGGGTALGNDALNTLNNNLPCHPPTPRQHELRLP